MLGIDTYGDYGYTSWEFPEMVTREKPLINDSDGRNYPWYGSSHQVVSIRGPISHTSKYTVTMRDFFHPWYVERLNIRSHFSFSLLHRNLSRIFPFFYDSLGYSDQ